MDRVHKIHYFIVQNLSFVHMYKLIETLSLLGFPYLGTVNLLFMVYTKGVTTISCGYPKDKLGIFI
ncbi:putative membrane protein [Paenibacillus phage vB_PlaP_API480]|nr:putative membrane protein [Paenibacillus phage vB_PlaP_API480]